MSLGGWGFVVAVVVVTVVVAVVLPSVVGIGGAVEGKGSSASFDFAFSTLRFLDMLAEGLLCSVVAMMKKKGS